MYCSDFHRNKAKRQFISDSPLSQGTDSLIKIVDLCGCLCLISEFILYCDVVGRFDGISMCHLRDCRLCMILYSYVSVEVNSQTLPLKDCSCVVVAQWFKTSTSHALGCVSKPINGKTYRCDFSKLYVLSNGIQTPVINDDSKHNMETWAYNFKFYV